MPSDLCSTDPVVVDDSLDETNFEQERIEYLVKFIAQRDGEDVRPALKAGKLDLAGLEDIYEHGYDADEMETKPEDNEGKGKGKSNFIP
jgi:hypothetical protein